MEFLRFSDKAPAYVPDVFLSAFSPTVRTVFPGEVNIARAFTSQGVSLAGNAFHARFLLDDMLPGTCELEQIHSGIVLEESAACPGTRGDGLFAARGSDAPVRTLGIRTADCLAVLFAACVGGVRYGAAVHAGWRGYASGIHLTAVEQLSGVAQLHGVAKAELLGSLEVLVAPAIFGASYECGHDVGNSLKACREHWFAHSSKKPDFAGVVGACLNVAEAGVAPSAGISYDPRKVYPDLQLLVVCDCLLAGVAHQNMRVIRENTWGSPILYSYRHASVLGKAEGRRLHTHLVFSGVA